VERDLRQRHIGVLAVVADLASLEFAAEAFRVEVVAVRLCEDKVSNVLASHLTVGLGGGTDVAGAVGESFLVL